MLPLLLPPTLLSLLSLLSRPTLADLTLFSHDGSTLLACPEAYTYKIGSVQNFPPRNGSVFLMGDLCDGSSYAVPPPGFDGVVFFTGETCDEAVPLGKIAGLENGTKWAVSMVASDRTDGVYFDKVIRFAFDPRPYSSVLHVTRVFAPCSHEVLTLLPNASFVEIRYRLESWFEMYQSPGYLVYYVGACLWYLVYIPQHAARALWLLHSEKKRRALTSTDRDFGQLVMELSCVLSIVQIGQFSLQALRDYGSIWIPEIVTQILWVYSYMILLSMMLLLLLFWSDILSASKANIRMIQPPSRRILVGFVICAFIVMTGFVAGFVFENPYSDLLKEVGFILLGIVAVVESIGTMIYGGRIIRELRNIKPIAERDRRNTVLSARRQSSTIVTTVASYNPAATVGSPSSRSGSMTEMHQNSDNPMFKRTVIPEEGESRASEGGEETPGGELNDPLPEVDIDGSSPRHGGAPTASMDGRRSRSERFPLVKSLISATATVATTPVAIASRLTRSPSIGNTDDSVEARKQKQALDRARPMTRIVVVAAFFLLIATALALVSAVTTTLNNPSTYWIIFLCLLVVEISVYGLIFYTASPIWKRRRARWGQKKSSRAELVRQNSNDVGGR